MGRYSKWMMGAVAVGLVGLSAAPCRAQAPGRMSPQSQLLGQSRFNLNMRPGARLPSNPALGAMPGPTRNYNSGAPVRQIAIRPPVSRNVYTYPVYHNGSLYGRTFDYRDAVRLQSSLNQWRGGQSTIGGAQFWRPGHR